MGPYLNEPMWHMLTLIFLIAVERHVGLGGGTCTAEEAHRSLLPKAGDRPDARSIRGHEAGKSLLISKRPP